MGKVGETRVNLKRLLEDIRDSYPVPLAEVILTELTANGLDSGASSIWFCIDAPGRSLTVMDNGRGMQAAELSTYHDIAASTKLRGKGIGFAGIGAKLALLVAQSVTTETRTSRKHLASSWSLSGPMRAPWKMITPPGWLKESSGTAVRITFPEQKSEGEELLNPLFIRDTLINHFSPLLDEELLKRLGRLYANRISFFLEDRPIFPDPLQVTASRRFFYVHVAKTKRPVGVGFLVTSDREFPESQRGIAVSTYGKVIKRGWEWIGVNPVRPNQITGILEIPALAQVLTTNKADFLKDQGSLRMFYRYRKAIQSAIEPILAELGEQPILPQSASHKRMGSTERLALQEVVTQMVTEFPELEPLVGMRRSADGKGPTSFPETFSNTPLFAENSHPQETALVPTETEVSADGVGEPPPALAPSEGDMAPIGIDIKGLSVASSKEGKRSKQNASLSISFEEDPQRSALGWLVDETLWINSGHPAYKKAMEMGQERYHTVIAVGWILATHVGNAEVAGEFLTRYLACWGRN